jgi:hypothetical protein
MNGGREERIQRRRKRERAIKVCMDDKCRCCKGKFPACVDRCPLIGPEKKGAILKNFKSMFPLSK